jgi:hypothetical protein
VRALRASDSLRPRRRALKPPTETRVPPTRLAYPIVLEPFNRVLLCLRLMVKKHFLLAMAAALTVVVAAGCGGSRSPGVASLGPSTTTSASSQPPPSAAGSKPNATGFVAFVDCLQRHGIQAQLGPGGRGVSITAANGPNSPQLHAAQKACQKLMPGGGPQPLSPAEQAQELRELLSLARCMRTHGYPSFPDPDGQGAFDFSGSSGFDPNSTEFQQAMSACRPTGAKVPLRIGIRVRQ